MKRDIVRIVLHVPDVLQRQRAGVLLELEEQRIRWGLPRADTIDFSRNAPIGHITETSAETVEVEVFTPANASKDDKRIFTGKATKRPTESGWEYSIRRADGWGITVFTS